MLLLLFVLNMLVPSIQCLQGCQIFAIYDIFSVWHLLCVTFSIWHLLSFDICHVWHLLHLHMICASMCGICYIYYLCFVYLHLLDIYCYVWTVSVSIATYMCFMWNCQGWQICGIYRHGHRNPMGHGWTPFGLSSLFHPWLVHSTNCGSYTPHHFAWSLFYCSWVTKMAHCHRYTAVCSHFLMKNLSAACLHFGQFRSIRWSWENYMSRS